MLKGCKPLYQVWGAFCELSLSWTKSTDETWIDIDPLKPAPWLLKKWILKLFMLGSGPCISENKYGSNPTHSQGLNSVIWFHLFSKPWPNM